MKRSALKISIGLFSLVFTVLMVQCKSNKVPQLGKDPVKDVIAAMTLEEKAYFVTGTGMNFPGINMPGDTAPIPGAPVIGQTQNLVPGAAGTTYEVPRLGIPSMVVADGPAGLRISPKRENDSSTYFCTAFPVATLLASTWDTELINKVGQAMGNDVLEYGADVLLGPGMNIHRNPLCGRNFEYYSEDPYVTGKMAAAMVNGVESQGVGTSIKHFAANNAETNRNALNTIVSERALREIYLEGFRIAVEEAQPWTVMSSYNLINGTMASESSDLLTKVLRDDWGFKGFVMTDWFGGLDPVAQMLAGNDLLMPGTPQQAKAIYNAVKEGKLDIAVLDRNIERILNVLLETPRFKGFKYSNKPDLQSHASIARQAAANGMVLLKNENATLPLAKVIKSIATFGTATFETVIGGTGSGDVNEAYIVSLADGLRNAGYIPDEALQTIYLDYIRKTRESMPKPKNPILALMGAKEPVPEMAVDADLAGRMAGTADIAVVTVGRNSGEGADRMLDNDFNLSLTEKAMINNVAKAFHAKGKKVIVLLNIGGVIETASWKNVPDAILLVWQAGQETGNSMADVVSGKINPSGKLAATFPVSYKDVPSAKDFPGIVTEIEQPNQKPPKEGDIMAFMRPKASKIVYEEGIYVGYRYYETFGVNPSFEFGYGMSYTTFEYSNLKLSSDKFRDTITVTVNVKNSGGVAGKEVVQLYISAPANKLDKPVIELKGFDKTKLLLPGESQTLSFNIQARQLSSFDAASSCWIAEAGKYTVKIGASSKDIRLNASFELNSEINVKKESVALVPKETIPAFKPGK
jgi:beta-glucosidase